MSTIVALLSGVTNAPILHNAAPSTSRHSDVQDQLPPRFVYTTKIPMVTNQINNQAKTLTPLPAGNQSTAPITATVQPTIVVNEGVDNYIEEERLRKDEEMSLMAQQIKHLESSI